jgi:preprotein translocase subunit SecG
MTVLSVLLLVFFIIVAVLLILLVLVQSEEGDSLGGIFAGGSGSAFGSRSGNVLTRATTVLGALFLVLSFGLALINRTPGGSGVEQAARELAPAGSSEWWREEEAPVPEEEAGIELPFDLTPPAESPADTGTAQ